MREPITEISIPSNRGEVSFAFIETTGGIYRPVNANGVRVVSDGIKNVFYFNDLGLFNKIENPHAWHREKFIATNETLKISFGKP